MTKSILRPCLACLFLIGSILIAACATPDANVSTANKNSGTSPSPSATTSGPGTPISSVQVGYVDVVGCDAIKGWVLNRANPEQAVGVEIYVDDKLQTSLAAGELRQDLLDAMIGTGKYGFVYMIPKELKDGKPHAIRVKVKGGNYEPEFFQSTPHSFSCKP